MIALLDLLAQCALALTPPAADSDLGAVPSLAIVADRPGETKRLGRRASSLELGAGSFDVLLQTASGTARLEPEPEHRGELEIELFRRLSPAVVLLVTTDSAGGWSGLGSGSMITPDGKIVTNHHVVAEHASVLAYFRPPPGAAFGKAFIGDVVRLDEVADLALVQLREVPENPQVVILGDLDELQVGADVHAIGHPVGETWSYTKGLVSQVRPAYEWTIGDTMHRATVIQTQTPINPGNSGGPLLDDSGKLVGVNTMVNTNAQGINYAVSVDDVEAFLARDSDRVARRPAPAPGPSSKDRVVEKDLDGDGRADAWAHDEDGDGKPEMVLFDEDANGTVDGVLFDTNENGEADGLGMDLNDDGQIDAYYVDTDEDGDWDQFAIDADSDGRPESIVPL